MAFGPILACAAVQSVVLGVLGSYLFLVLGLGAVQIKSDTTPRGGDCMADFPNRAASWLQMALSLLADALTVAAHLTPWCAAAVAGSGRFPAAAA